MKKNNNQQYDTSLNTKTLIDAILRMSFVVGPLTLPIAILAKEADDRWISFAATAIFILLLVIKRMLKKRD